MIAIFTAGGLAILISGFGTPILLRWLTRNRIGQHILNWAEQESEGRAELVAHIRMIVHFSRESCSGL